MYRVVLRRLVPADSQEFVKLAEASVDLHANRVITPKTAEEFTAYVDRHCNGEAEAFLVRRQDTGDAVGLITISGIVRWPYLRAILGYAAFAPTSGRGYMTEGLSLALQYGFGRLGLHRMEADIQPDNNRSLRMAARLGFRQEGYSPGFIFINGRWQDYERWAITEAQASGLEPCEEWQLPDNDF